MTWAGINPRGRAGGMRPEVAAVLEEVRRNRRLEAILAVLKDRGISTRGRRNGKRRLAEEVLRAVETVDRGFDRVERTD